FFFQAEDGIRDFHVTGVQTCALPIYPRARPAAYPAGTATSGADRCADGLGHDVCLPVSRRRSRRAARSAGRRPRLVRSIRRGGRAGDRKSTRLNSSHVKISYAVFCLKKKKAVLVATTVDLRWHS